MFALRGAELLWRRWAHSAVRTARQISFLPRNRLTSQHPPAVSFEPILCFILIYFAYPLARCVLRQLLLCFTPFWLRKDFIRMLCFCVSGGACVLTESWQILMAPLQFSVSPWTLCDVGLCPGGSGLVNREQLRGLGAGGCRHQIRLALVMELITQTEILPASFLADCLCVSVLDNVIGISLHNHPQSDMVWLVPTYRGVHHWSVPADQASWPTSQPGHVPPPSGGSGRSSSWLCLQPCSFPLVLHLVQSRWWGRGNALHQAALIPQLTNIHSSRG